MKLYHGSLEKVEKPEIRIPNRTLDYGFGFYATTSYEQALNWVHRRMEENGAKIGYVNSYEFELDMINSLKSLVFKNPTEEWVDFVMKNRTDENYTHEYDIVYGPVANDRVYLQFALYEGNLISKHTLIHELKTYKLIDQYLFHTEKALQSLKYIESIEVR